jgi:8-oxo-dGTP diphosphatase
MDSLQIVRAQTPFPTKVVKTLFLAGPSEPHGRPTAWRQEAIQILRDLRFDGHVFVPDFEEGWANGNLDAQFDWVTEAMDRADAIVFWVPRDLQTLHGYSTNIEWGLYARSRNVVWGAPEDAQLVGWAERYAKKYQVPVVRDLKMALRVALEHLIGSGALREGDDARISLPEWRKKQAAPVVYPKPDLTADNVVLHRDSSSLLLIRRKKDPYKGLWALPGGYVNKGEESKAAAARELLEEAGLVSYSQRLIGVFGKEGRDPRGWVVSHAYFSQANTRDIKAGDDAVEAAWFSLDEVDTMQLAFDHRDILREAIDSGMI